VIFDIGRSDTISEIAKLGQPETAECKGGRRIDAECDGVWDNLVLIARKPLILKRRDVRVVEGARLESEARQPH
jgi:hypothetical protein